MADTEKTVDWGKDRSPQKKRRWKTWLGVALLASGICLVLLDGPVARWYIHKLLIDHLSKNGLSGEVSVHGNLHSGIRLSGANFRGSGILTHMEFETVSVQYRFFELLQKKLRHLEARGVKASFTLAETDTETPAEKPKKKNDHAGEKTATEQISGVGETMRMLRKIFAPVSIDFQDIELKFSREGMTAEPPRRFYLERLTHQPNSPDILVSAISTDLLGEIAFREQDIRISWEEDRLGIERIRFTPDISIEQAVMRFSDNAPLSFEMLLKLAESGVEFRADATGLIMARLTDGPIDLGKLDIKELDSLKGKTLAGNIESFRFSSQDLLTDSSKARADLEFRATGLQAGETTIPNPFVSVSLDEGRLSSKIELEDVIDLRLNGPVVLKGDGLDRVDLSWSLVSKLGGQSAKPPVIAGKVVYSKGEQSIEFQAGLKEREMFGLLALSAGYSLSEKRYGLDLKTDLSKTLWLSELLAPVMGGRSFSGPLKLAMKGDGSLLERTHAGELSIGRLVIAERGKKPIQVVAKAQYDWPSSVVLSRLNAELLGLKVRGEATWEDEVLSIPRIDILDKSESLASLAGRLPVPRKLPDDTNGWFKQDLPIDLHFSAPALGLQDLGKRFALDLPSGLMAQLSTGVHVTGTFAEPGIEGHLAAKGIRIKGRTEIPDMELASKLSGDNRGLRLGGILREDAGELLKVDASLKTETIADFLDPDQPVSNLPLSGELTIADFKLSRLSLFAPALSEAVGRIDAKIAARGSLKAPRLDGTATVELTSYPLPKTPFRQIQNSRLSLELKGQDLIVQSSPIELAGGALTLDGTIHDALGGAPVMDLNLRANQALVWRDDQMILRSDAGLKLNGPFTRAKLSGNLSIVESLFYKDIEIITFQVPVHSAPKPQLPMVDSAPAPAAAP